MNGWMIAIVLLIHQSFIDKKEHWMILLTNTYLVMIIALAIELNCIDYSSSSRRKRKEKLKKDE